MSRANSSGSGRLALSSRLSSLIQNRSRLSLSRFSNSSYGKQRHPVDRNPGPIEGFRAARHRQRASGVPRLVLRGEAVRADSPHPALGHAVLRIGEGVELDDHLVADMHKAAAAADNVCLDLKRRVPKGDCSQWSVRCS